MELLFEADRLDGGDDAAESPGLVEETGSGISAVDLRALRERLLRALER